MLIKQKFIFREDLKNNPDIYYLFGDNTKRVGLGGQAKEMRGEPNAIGIATKISPSNEDAAFFTDDQFRENQETIVKDFFVLWRLLIENNKINIIVPSDGLGTGLSAMDTRCPETFKFLNYCLFEVEQFFQFTRFHSITATADFDNFEGQENIDEYIEKYNATQIRYH